MPTPRITAGIWKWRTGTRLARHARVVVGGDQEHRCFPNGARPWRARRNGPGPDRRSARCSPPWPELPSVWMRPEVFPGRVVRDAEGSVKVGWSPSSRSSRSSWLNMSSSDAPQVPTKAGSAKSWRSTICLKPLPRKEALHVVEVRFAAVDEARVIAVAPQQIGRREEAALRARRFSTAWASVGDGPGAASRPRTERVPVA